MGPVPFDNLTLYYLSAKKTDFAQDTICRKRSARPFGPPLTSLRRVP